MAVKRTGKKMLGDKIAAKLNKPKVKDFDIEDEDFRSTTNADKNNDDDDDEEGDEKELEEMAKREHYVKVSKSKIRDTTINLGDKYIGSKIRRDELFEDSKPSHNEIEEEDIIINDDDLNSFSSASEQELEDELEQESETENKSQSEQEEESNGEIMSEDDDIVENDAYKRDRIAKLLNSEKQQILSRLSTSAKSDALKGYTILKQNSEYDKILDARIKMQKAILSSNNLPVNLTAFNEFKTDETDTILESTEEKLYSLIDRLIRVRSCQLVKNGLISEALDVKVSKKRKLSDYLEANKKINEAVEPVTKSVLVKWSNRVQSASGVGVLNQGKFKVINQSVWNQVNNQFGDLERLIKKTRINRRGVVPLGYEKIAEREEAKSASGNNNGDDYVDNFDDVAARTAGLSNIDKSLQTNHYIFDDDDFYRLLLNDMINKKLDQKQAHSSAILMLSKNKMQKSYDRMATKGRKLKYTVQEPLQQFEIPRRKAYTWNDDQIDELFAGLFGMNFKMDDSDESANESDVDEQKSEDISALKESGVKLFG